MIKQIEDAQELLSCNAQNFEREDWDSYAVIDKLTDAALKMLRGEAWWDISSAPKPDQSNAKTKYKEIWLLATDGEEIDVTRYCTEYPYDSGVWMRNYEPTDYIPNINSWNPTHWRPLDDGETLMKLMEDV